MIVTNIADVTLSSKKQPTRLTHRNGYDKDSEVHIGRGSISWILDLALQPSVALLILIREENPI